MASSLGFAQLTHREASTGSPLQRPRPGSRRLGNMSHNAKQGPPEKYAARRSHHLRYLAEHFETGL